ncbi:MAG TPA: lysophospholipid acyltransferase family protein [Stellaceae bacterium]|nr:lysophospholipid acyltransferase family protein [Stellaceae bacterium]
MKRPREWARRFVRSDRLRRVLCFSIHLYIRFVFATNRWTVEGAEHPSRLRAAGKPFILAFWHGRLMMIPMAWQRLAPIHMLISAHRDGRIIADAVAHFGVQTVTGSTRRGGSAALRTMVKALAAGDCVGITPDGPAGPAMVASAGIINVARLGRVPIIPVTFAASRRREMRSWDRMQVALPFGRCAFIWGEPIDIGTELDEAGVEQARQLVERRMLKMVVEAEKRVGHNLSLPPTPSPIPESPSPPAAVVQPQPLTLELAGEGSR